MDGNRARNDLAGIGVIDFEIQNRIASGVLRKQRPQIETVPG
jgi:hypothetical protein